MGFTGAVLVVVLFFGSACSHSCPNLTEYDLDLSPLQGMWDTVFFTGPEGSSVEWVPKFFNLSICGPLENSPCGPSSSVCYTEDRTTYSLGRTTSRRFSYTSRTVTIKYDFSGEAVAVYGLGNVTINLICGRTLGIPQVVNGDPHLSEILIMWETSAACKTSTSRRYTLESKCYHVHTYHQNGLRASLVDLTSLIRPQGYQVKSSDGTTITVSICKPLVATSSSATCNGSMACARRGKGQEVVLLGAWSEDKEMQLHMHNGLLSVQYSMKNVSEDCGTESSTTHTRNVRIHFICPKEDQDLGPHIAFHDPSLCLIIISWYTSFACGNVAIQSRGCSLTTQGGQTFDLTGLSSRLDLSAPGTNYVYSFQICQGKFGDCDPSVASNTRVIQKENRICRSLGVGSGYLRYADGSLTLTFRNGDSCHSNFRRTSEISFVCPADLENQAGHNGGGSSRNNSVRFLGEVDCFYTFEWVTEAACGTKESGVASCQFEVPKMGLYDFSPLVGTRDTTWIGVSGDKSYLCFLVSPCGRLSVSGSPYSSSVSYCSSSSSSSSGSAVKAPRECKGASVCAIMSDAVIPAGLFDLSKSSSIKAVDANVVSVSGRWGNNTALIHYVCKPGDLASAPIFVGVIDQTVYEFHWKTFAACPRGLTAGSACSVMHQGYLFNLTSIPVLHFNTSDGSYSYTLSVCSSLSSRSSNGCNKDSKTSTVSMCQLSHANSQYYVLGRANSTLVYQDGVLKLTYNGGATCHHVTGSRNTTVLFICDDSAREASISSVTEDDCTYVVEVRTNLACPAAVRSSECTFRHGGQTYDFSSLSRSGVQGNWETRGRDGAVYLINVCQPLNFATGCHPLAGVCRVKTDHRGTITRTNLGMASNATFKFVDDKHGGHVQLLYNYAPSEVGDSGCPRWTTIVELYCADSIASAEPGPHFLSGGTLDAKCEYIFTWRSEAACPLRETQTIASCQVMTPTNYTIDLTPLSVRPDNSYVYRIGVGGTASPSNSFSFNMSVCRPLPTPCNGNSGVAVCQQDSNGKKHSCGLHSTQRLTYFDGSLALNFSGGELCQHTRSNRSVLVTFECDRLASVNNTLPTFLNESSCSYLFTWPTPLACLPQELDCVAAGGKYDLRPLMQRRSWVVESRLTGVTYVIGGCRSLDFRRFPSCPQVPWMGACRYNQTTSRGMVGSALGYMTGNIIEEDEGVLRLEYHNGDSCPGGGKSMVHIHFTCGPGTREGVPTLDESSSTCHTHINWVTQYACSRLTNSSTSSSSASGRWVLSDPVTSAAINLTSLPASLSRVYAAPDGSSYKYTVSLREGSVSCDTGHHNVSNGEVGACQVKVAPKCSSSCVYVLGYRGVNSSAVSLVDGVVTAEYRNGDKCKHEDNLWRQATITFLCDQRDPFLEVLPEDNCAYAFIVHTALACVKATPIGVECQVEGYQDLVSFQRRSWNRVSMKDSNREFFMSVCDPLGTGVKGCSPGAAACMLNKTAGKYVNLGIPSSHYPPKTLGNQDGVLLKYVEGDVCQNDVRWQTNLLLVCNKNVPEGVPEFVGMSNCVVTMRWEGVSACRTSLPFCRPSKDRCRLTGCAGTPVDLDFTSFLSNTRLLASDDHGGSYAIQLCGSGTPVAPPTGCDTQNTGICHLVPGHGKGSPTSNTAVVYSNHSFSVVSQSPRVIDVIFHSGAVCPSNRDQNYSAIVHMVCSRTGETAMPKLVSDKDCELHFDWRNATFCAGESVSRGCAATGPDGYTYSLDAMISQKWTGVAGPSSSSLGTFSLAICRNLNPFSSSGLHCSSPSAICWHTNDGRHVNLGRPSSAPYVKDGTSARSILIKYESGDVCNSATKERYHTRLYIHCSNKTSSPILSRDDKTKGNCSWQISMTSPQACQYPSSSTSCFIRTASGIFNFTDLAQKPLSFKGKKSQYNVCLCGGGACGSGGITAMDSGGSAKNLGNFTSLSVSSSTGGPRFAYYNGDSCGKSSSTRYQSWLLAECSRDPSSASTNTLIEDEAAAPSTCSKVFLWYTPRACHSKNVGCSIVTASHDLYDFSLLHSVDRPWKVTAGHATFFINICGEIGEFTDGASQSCGEDVSVCKKDGSSTLTAIGLTNTQQITVNNGVVKFSYTGVTQKGGAACSSTITMECGLHRLQYERKESCKYYFRWRSPHACRAQERPQVFQSCEQVTSSKQDGPLVFHPSKIPTRTWSDPQRGTFSLNLCGKSEQCEGDDSVCVTGTSNTKKSIASHSSSSIMVDGEQMLIMMNGTSTHAVIRIVCLGDGDANYASLKDRVVLDNLVQNGSHTYYYFTVYAELGQGCTFVIPVPATEADATTANARPVDKSRGRHSVIGAVAVVISLAVVATIAVLVAIFYKKSRRNKVRKVLVNLTVGKSNEPVRYHKLSTKETESLLKDSDSNSDESEEIPLRSQGEGARKDNKDEAEDEELIDL